MRRTILPSATPTAVWVSEFNSRNSLIAKPTGSTYTAKYTCSPRGLPPAEITWVDIDNMTAATSQQTAEFGSITGFQFTVTGGTKVDFDMTASR